MTVSHRHTIRIRRLEVACMRAIADVLNMSRGESRFFDALDFFVSKVQVDRDLRTAIVYFYTQLDVSQQTKLVRFLQNRTSFFFKQLKSCTKIRNFPVFEFRFDQQEESKQSLEQIFHLGASIP